jgi:predicted nucleotidyltransferase
MHPDELFVAELLRALATVQLEAIVVGSTAAALQGAPVMTQDIDLLVRDTERNREKLRQLATLLGTGAPIEQSPLSRTITLLGAAVAVDILFDDLPGRLTFEALRSRAKRVAIGSLEALVASLEDIIASKEACARPKDLAQLPILRDTLRVIRALDQSGA